MTMERLPSQPSLRLVRFNIARKNNTRFICSVRASSPIFSTVGVCRASQAFHLRDDSGANHDRVSVTLHVPHLIDIGDAKPDGDRERRKPAHPVHQFFRFPLTFARTRSRPPRTAYTNPLA